MADVAAFDKAGQSGTSSAGALIHETTEQLEKAYDGLGPGERGNYKNDYLEAHKIAITAENSTDGNSRNEKTDVYTTPYGFQLKQTLTPTPTGGIKVTKRYLR